MTTKMTRRRWFLTAVVVLLAIAGGGWWGYQVWLNQDISSEELGVEEEFFSFENLEELEGARPQVGEILDEQGENGQEDVTSGDSTGNEGVAQGMNAGDSSGEGFPSGAGSEVAGNSSSGSSSEQARVAAIEAKYFPRIEVLEDVALARLDTLIANGMTEYQVSQESGDPSAVQIFTKYYRAGMKLQKSVDQTFEQYVSEMQQELESQGLPTDSVKEIRQTYQQKIGSKRSELMGMAQQAL